jgi:twinkle protein
VWYKGRLLVYDDTDLTEDEDETESLLEIVEEAIIRKNCEMILLDNLMTAMEDGADTNEALYRKQSDFVGKLAKMARRLKVIIILVAHPRKTSNEIGNDDVSGSADITNKASLVMSYSRITHGGDEPDPTVRALSVTKNRLTGRLGSVRVYFSEDSKRISDNSLNFDKKYIQDEFGNTDDDEEIPF